MTDDKRSEADGHPGDGPAGSGDPADVLRRAARDVRAAAALQAFVPLSSEERERLADRAIEQVLGPATPASETAPRQWWRRRTVGVVGVATAALAAAVALLLVRPRSAEPLARYAMVVEGEQRARG